MGESKQESAPAQALAYRLAGKASSLDTDILHALIGRPKRFSDLRPLLGKKTENNLTVALARLQELGLLDRRTDARANPPIHTYELSPLGIQTVLSMQTIRPLQESLDDLRAAVVSSLDAAGKQAQDGLDPVDVVGKHVTLENGEDLGTVVDVGLYAFSRVKFLIVEKGGARTPIRIVGIEAPKTRDDLETRLKPLKARLTRNKAESKRLAGEIAKSATALRKAALKARLEALQADRKSILREMKSLHRERRS